MTTETPSVNETIHIGLDVPASAPDFFVERITTDLKASGLSIKVHKHEDHRMYAALEWIIPTAIAAYILKPYFEGFLNEAGKDHYQILRAWLKTFVDNARAIKVHTIYSPLATKKRNNENTQSKSVSLLLQTKSGKIIKLLFDDTLTKDDWDNAIDQLLDFAVEHYEKSPNDRLSAALNNLELERKTHVYAIIDKDSKQLIFFDDNKLVQLHREQMNKQKNL